MFLDAVELNSWDGTINDKIIRRNIPLAKYIKLNGHKAVFDSNFNVSIFYKWLDRTGRTDSTST